MIKKDVKGLITKVLRGSYYVKTSDDVVECSARGTFRKMDFPPCVGDNVVIEIDDNNKGCIDEVMQRKNSLLRPPLANLDRIVMIVSTKDPVPSTEVLDKLIAVVEYKKIEPVIIITKTDLDEECNLAQTYKKAGFQSFNVSAITGEGVEELKQLLSTGISAFCGNTGVGKSTLLNAIDTNLALATAEISQKLGRGKHTTRHVELFMLPTGGYIADTPGFSSIETERFEIIFKGELENCFREFEQYIPYCKFTGCSHTKEKSCRVLQAVNDGDIVKSRHDSYVKMYEEAKGIKEWEKKQKHQ